MRLTTKSEYSLLALTYLARNSAAGYIAIKEICNNYHIPKKYLEYLMFILKQNRIVKAKRGLNGGYQLARPACKISIAEIIRLLDGALAPTDSVSVFFYSHTPLEKEQKITHILKEIRDYISEKLENINLEQLI